MLSGLMSECSTPQLLQVVQRPEHLRRVRAHRPDVQPDATPVLFGQLPQIQVLHAATRTLMRVHRIVDLALHHWACKLDMFLPASLLYMAARDSTGNISCTLKDPICSERLELLTVLNL